jgi:hypothetical protein
LKINVAQIIEGFDSAAYESGDLQREFVSKHNG